VLLHTDGLEELREKSGERFGAERVAALLQAHAAADPTLVLGALLLEAEQFAPSTGREEDVTLVCLKAR
jgi:serine phosphatase RsbU (regulator of sigma subunit)